MAQTRILHVSDSHLGRRQYGSDVRCDDFAKAFEQAIAIAVERDVDAVIHTGDLFDDPRPTLSSVLRCADTLDPPAEFDIPVYGIVGNHEWRNDKQWLDLFRKANAVSRLSREPSVVENTALYGIDAVRPGDWETTDFALEKPPGNVDYTILCMHELLEPPVDGTTANYPVRDVLERVNIDLDGLALGGFHQPASTRVDGTDIWYAGATERGGADETEAGVVQLLEINDGEITRRQFELETRPFVTPTIRFGNGNGSAHVREVLEQYDLTDAVVKAELVEDDAVTANEVTKMAHDAGATVVDVDDNRGYVDCSERNPVEKTLQTAQNAIETAALRDSQHRSGVSTASTERNVAETANCEWETRTDDFEQDAEVLDGPPTEREESVGERDKLERRVSELGLAIEDVQAAVDVVEDDLAATITERDAATEAFLPDDRLPESVSNDTRDTVASYVETLEEKKDVHSAELAEKIATLKAEKKNAADAREAAEETATVIERLEDRIDEFESLVDDAREELDDARSQQFDEGLTALEERFATFDIDLSGDSLNTVIDSRVPERNGTLQESIEVINGRITELSTRQSKLEDDRDELQSIDGEANCPKCSQKISSERKRSELAEIGSEIDEIERRLDAAIQERDELVERREELDELRAEAIDLRAFRSETVAEAEGRIEDLQENLTDLREDLEEERAELAATRGERDEADAAIDALETEINDIEAEIAGLESTIEAGESSIAAFESVDRLQGELEDQTDELWDLQEEYTEMKTERETFDAERGESDTQ